MTTIQPAVAQAFVQRIVTQFDNIKYPEASENSYFNLALLRNELARLEQQEQQNPTHDAEQKRLELYNQAPNLSKLFELTQWLNPPYQGWNPWVLFEEMKRNSMLTALMRQRLHDWDAEVMNEFIIRLVLNSSVTLETEFYTYIFLRVMRGTTVEEKRALLAQLNPDRFHLGGFSYKLQQLTNKVHNIFVLASSEKAKEIAFIAQIIICGAIYYWVLPSLLTWTVKTALPIVERWVMPNRWFALGQAAQAVYFRALTLANYTAQTRVWRIITFSPRGVPVGEFLWGNIIPFVLPPTKRAFQILALKAMYKHPLGDFLKIISIAHQVNYHPFIKIKENLIMGIPNDISDKQKLVEGYIKAYQVWMYLMTEGPRQKLFIHLYTQGTSKVGCRCLNRSKFIPHPTSQCLA